MLTNYRESLTPIEFSKNYRKLKTNNLPFRETTVLGKNEILFNESFYNPIIEEPPLPSGIFITPDKRMTLKESSEEIPYFSAIVSEKLSNGIKEKGLLAAVLKGIETLMSEVCPDYNVLSAKFKNHCEDEINAYFRHFDVYNHELRAAAIVKGNEKLNKVDFLGKLVEVQRFMRLKGRYHCLDDEEVSEETRDDIEKGLNDLLVKKNVSKNLSSIIRTSVHESDNLNNPELVAVYIIGPGGNYVTSMINEKMRGEINENGDLVTPLLTAAHFIFYELIGDYILEDLNLRKNVKKMILHFENFKFNKKEWNVVTLYNGEVDKDYLDNKIRDVKPLMESEEFSKYLTSNEAMPKQVNDLVERRLKEIFN